MALWAIGRDPLVNKQLCCTLFTAGSQCCSLRCARLQLCCRTALQATCRCSLVCVEVSINTQLPGSIWMQECHFTVTVYHDWAPAECTVLLV